MKKLILLTLMIQMHAVFAYELQPSTPREGQEVSIVLLLFCPDFPAATVDEQTHHFEILNDNTIRLTIVLSDGMGCVGGQIPVTATYSLGHLPEGEYSLEVYSIDQNQSLPAQNPDVFLTGLENFQVLGALQAVPTLSSWALIILISLCLLIVVRRFKAVRLK